MDPVFIEPEYGRRAGEPGAVYRQPDPVADGGVLRLAHAEDVFLFHCLLQ